MKRIKAVVAALVLVLAAPAMAGNVVFVDDGAAIRGTDPVAYFRDGKPVKGSTSF